MQRHPVALLAALLLASCPEESPAPAPPAAGPRRISETGLYADLAHKQIAYDLIPFAPAHVLWSDGAVKRRWIRVPPGKQIDTSDPEHWKFPVGTQFFKEFSLGGTLLETRLIERVGDSGDDRRDYWMGAFVWLPDGSDAIFAAGGANDVNGTPHDVPTADECWHCHQGEPGHILGFSALQLAGPRDGLTLESLAAMRLLGTPIPTAPRIPGDDATRAALGWLHANCGHCHNPNGSAWSDTSLILRLDLDDPTPADTPTYRTTVGVAVQEFHQPPYTTRIVPGAPEASELFYRMSSRGSRAQMPPLATEVVDPDGEALVRAWITSLP